MKIYSYNINGIRSSIRKNMMDWVMQENIELLCLQEIKALTSQIENIWFYNTGFYYNYFHSAKKKGYSGVGILSKKQPKHVEIGTQIGFIDEEGRVIRVDFDNFSVMSLYIPSGSNINRLNFKMKFCNIFLNYIKDLKKSIPNLIILGDYNICHKEIDIHDPIRNSKNSGFLPIERAWLSSFINECEMLDAFRIFNKKPHYYSWWSYRFKSRSNNKGWRIDYAMVSKSLEVRIKNSGICYEAKHSDHCPIWVEIEL